MVVKASQTCDAFHKFGVILARSRHPLHLGKSRHAWQHHVFGLRCGGNVLGPKVALHADDAACDVCRHRIGARIEAIHLFYGQETANSLRLVKCVFRLILVEIGIFARASDNVVPCLCGLGPR